MSDTRLIPRCESDFFDLQECEVDNFNIKEMSPFCRLHRQDEAFDALCVKGDREHLSIAKQTRDVHIYHCHAGLLEGIVPLYDRKGLYLGAIVFGQPRDREKNYLRQEKPGNVVSENVRHRGIVEVFKRIHQ